MKFTPENLNPSPYPLHPTNTYTYGYLITLAAIG